MSEEPIIISNLNDFVFCPASIYYHQLGSSLDKILYQNKAQIDGSFVHEKIDSQQYSTSKTVLQGISVYSEKYNLIGKIDIFDTKSKVLTERKNKITKIYDGYIFQLYAQYFSLKEMGYDIKGLRLYSYSDNKNYKIKLPENDPDMLSKFNALIKNMFNFNLENFKQTNSLKCKTCIYSELCDRKLENAIIN